MYVPKTRPIEDTSPAAPKQHADISRPELTFVGNGEATGIRALLVEDETMLCDLFTRVLAREGYSVVCAHSGAAALTLLRETPVDIVLSDVYLPDTTGLELLGQMLALKPDLPVILVTGRGNVEMARQALEQGASDFLTKPLQISELPIILERNLARQAVHQRRVRQFQQALHTSNESILDALLSALNTRDTETEGHSERVTAYTIELAEILGVSAREMYHIERGALLHDIGKIGIPDGILLKPGALTTGEWVEMRKHPEIGFQMCARVEMLQQAATIVLHHHEAWDGSGYPHGLAGQAIPLGARIFAVADTLDAMTSHRPYRVALPFQVALDEISAKAGTQFDPEVVRVFRSIREARWSFLRSLAHPLAA